jgi:hypothetical protein
MPSIWDYLQGAQAPQFGDPRSLPPPPMAPMQQPPMLTQQATPPVPVTNFLKSMAEPVLTAGDYLGGIMQGSQHPNWHDTLATGAGLASMFVPGPAAEEGALARGVLGAAKPSAVISQRLPTAAKAVEDPFSSILRVEMDALRRNPDLFEHNVNITRGYPNVRLDQANLPTEELAKQFMQHNIDNLLWMYEQIPPAIRARSKLWYEGANTLAQRSADEHGIPLASAGAAYAAQSPQKDWFMNASLGDRVINIVRNQQGTRFSPEMTEKALTRFADPKWQPLLEAIQGKQLGELDDPALKALWVRLYDESHHDPGYHILSPEGQRLGPALNADGTPSRIAWGSGNEIGKAIRAIEANGDLRQISQLMGGAHKVRNFYNNIVDPFSPHGDVTIDTHAVAGSLLRPLSGNSPEVAHNFGNYVSKDVPATRESALTGVKGLYPLYADIFRNAASDVGLLPRELQSIDWEGARGLFPDTFKTKRNVADIDAIWHNYRTGNVSADEARRLVYERAGGIRPPDWAR